MIAYEYLGNDFYNLDFGDDRKFIITKDEIDEISEKQVYEAVKEIEGEYTNKIHDLERENREEIFELQEEINQLEYKLDILQDKYDELIDKDSD